ncbi:bleomycin resistance protein [Burkholderia sp. F1]|uniref:bleomycin resistance protein n=1 Tax=Burkholderia sp. F1 TaxID=3366817 RepID=UPI003D751F15
MIVRRLDHSLDFHTRLLGFHVRFRRSEPDFAYLEQEGVQLMLEQYDANDDDAGHVGELIPPFGRGINLQMELRSIAPLCERLRIAGVPLYREPTDHWYPVGDVQSGQREVLVQDPDGYLLRFCEILGERALE